MSVKKKIRRGNADVGDVVKSPVAFAEDSHASFISSRLRQDLNLKRGLSSHWYTPATFVWLWCCNPNCVHVSLNGTKDRISLSFFLALIKPFCSFNAFYFLFIDALTQFSMRRSTGSIYLWYNVIEKTNVRKIIFIWGAVILGELKPMLVCQLNVMFTSRLFVSESQPQNTVRNPQTPHLM